MRDLTFLELAVLHWCEEIAEPAQWKCAITCVELIPKYNRHLIPKPRVSYLMKRTEEFRRSIKLRQVEC